ncbi:sensor histidine kinase [Paenibacillaceae bacterium WGS1546]|uniref:sensor histidine kinase n=1 Tax=Cohnella sp. WGS1546 TaxID=3366810 RepID=UPI00372D77D5
MKLRRTSVEATASGFKAALLVYAIFSIIRTSFVPGPESTLATLLYISAHFSFYIARRPRWKAIYSTGALLVAGASACLLHPFYLLLVPAHIYEIGSLYRLNKGLLLLSMLLPIVFLEPPAQFLFGLVAALTFIFYKSLYRYAGLVEKLRNEIDRQRTEIDRLTLRLNENREWRRQAEYTHKLEERNRLSQEMHDQIGHSMTGALFQMEAAKRFLYSEPERAEELLQNAIHISKDGIERTRSVLQNIKPLTEQLGFNRMKLFIDEFAVRHGIRAVLTGKGNMDAITAMQWRIIHENVQEALTNSLKYAEATAVSVEIEVLHALVKAVVADNGKGASKVVKGLGILGMEERAAEANGTIIVDGSRGFSVTTLLPISDSSETTVRRG